MKNQGGIYTLSSWPVLIYCVPCRDRERYTQLMITVFIIITSTTPVKQGSVRTQGQAHRPHCSFCAIFLDPTKGNPMKWFP